MAPNDTKPDPVATLMRDWQTIWQSELAAMAVDREILDGVATAAQVWAGVTAAFTEAMRANEARDATEARDTTTGAGTAPGTTTAAAAPGAGEPEIERLSRRVAELERRLAELDRPDKPKRPRRPAAGRT